MSIHSKCPAKYVRPKGTTTLCRHSPSSRSESTRLLATYIGAHLVLGGYSECDVAPWKDDVEVADFASMTVKEVKAYCVTRGVGVSGVLDREDLEAKARAAPKHPKAPTRVVNHMGPPTAESEYVSDMDLRLEYTAAAAERALQQASMVR